MRDGWLVAPSLVPWSLQGVSVSKALIPLGRGCPWALNPLRKSPPAPPIHPRKGQ